MVTSATNFSRTGLSDWLLQRVSAVILLAYSVFVFGVFAVNPDLNYAQWSQIFSHTGIKLFSLVSVLALSGHAWIGMWTIATDYLTTLQLGAKATAIRLLFQIGCALLITIYLLWGIQIFWGS